RGGTRSSSSSTNNPPLFLNSSMPRRDKTIDSVPSSLVPSGNGVQFSSAGLVLPADLPLEHWKEIGGPLFQIERGINWAIGDCLNYGESRYGEKYEAAVVATGRDVQTLMNVKWVASRFEISRRRENLSWSHHAEVAAL